MEVMEQMKALFRAKRKMVSVVSVTNETNLSVV